MHFIYYYVAASKAQCSFFQSLDRSHQIYMLFEKYKQEPLSFVPYNYVLYISARTLGLTARKLVFREFSDSECVRTLPIGTCQWVAPVHCCWLEIMANSPVFIVTGASRGIGKAVVLQSLLKFNARVVAVARSGELLEELRAEAAKLGKESSLEVLKGDVTEESLPRHAVNRAVDKWGQLDGVIANAG